MWEFKDANIELRADLMWVFKDASTNHVIHISKMKILLPFGGFCCFESVSEVMECIA